MTGDKVTAGDGISGYPSHVHVCAQKAKPEKPVIGCHLSPQASPASSSADAARQIRPADRWGPFADQLDAAERLAGLPSLQAIVRLYCGPRGNVLAGHLRNSERDADHLLSALAALDLRRVLATAKMAKQSSQLRFSWLAGNLLGAGSKEARAMQGLMRASENSDLSAVEPFVDQGAF